MGGKNWKDDDCELLKSLWGQGLTAGEIAEKMGRERNAIIGKAHRMKLKKRPSPIQAGKKKQPPKPSPVMKSRKQARYWETPTTAIGTPTRLKDLRDDQCRWPIGDPKDADFHFCGAKSCRRGYCKHHAKMAYRRIDI